MDFATGPIGHKKHIENLVEMGGDFCLQDAEIKLKQDLANGIQQAWTIMCENVDDRATVRRIVVDNNSEWKI